MAAEAANALLDAARRLLASAGIATAALDARLLLQAAAQLRHEQLIADPARPVAAEAVAAFRQMVARRTAREPVSRILGAREFYGRVFAVTSAVLDPRPDTETLIDEALRHMKPGARILDIGTGSGAIIVTLLAECPQTTGVATDVSAAALAVARGNAESLGVAARLEFLQTGWCEGVAGVFDLIVSNPPYIAPGEIARLEAEVRDFDPWLALDGGADGLDAYRAIAAEAGSHLAAGGHLLVEIGAGQETPVEAIFAAGGLARLAARADLGGHVRCLVFALA